MNWLQEAFLEPTMVQAVIIISLVSALGLYLGRIKIFGISLGITFVFFAGHVIERDLALLLIEHTGPAAQRAGNR